MLIGLTGMSGAGKSTVAVWFEKRGFRLIDCDALVHSLYEDRQYAMLVENAFGKDYIRNGSVDRKKLGALVFSDSNALKKLNETVSPFIMTAVTACIETARKQDIATVLDAPLLFEYGLEKFCDLVIGVTADIEIAVSRLSVRDGRSESEIRSRLASQHNAAFFRESCDYVLENNGDLQMLAQNFEDMMEKIYIYR
ncbi:MAG: dephospho-CoA kinase [Clostridia bacterium]|nr:dephospho-CoA kinase [Clostridia bacterium]